ncbi:MAG: beta-lactamase family protein [Candidatus Obscuribacterales bacterium]|nr:beta-lactamase family protein [Candidatus Obscuribacterales bacterium]
MNYTKIQEMVGLENPMLTESTRSQLQSQFEVSAYRRGRAVASAAVIGSVPTPWSGEFDGTTTWPTTTEQRFPIYSLTKSFIACATLQLVEQGSLDLDGLLGLWLPDLPFAYQITIRQLLNHTSGLPDYGGMEAYQQSVKNRPGEPWTDEEFISYTCGNRLRSTPGQTFNYSNIGYLYLKILLQSITGASLADVLRDRIFTPLSLKSTSVHTTLEEQATLVSGYSRFLTLGQSTDVREIYHPGWVSHGLIASTALDVATFYHALFDPDEPIISYDSLAEMREFVKVTERHPIFRNPGYGLGLMVDERITGNILGHTGSGPGYTAAAYVLMNPFGDPITAAALVSGEDPDHADGIVTDLLTIAQEQ